MTRAARGFTLVELLAALVVFGFVVAGLAEGVRMGLLASRVQGTLIARDADLDAASRALARLVTLAAPGGPAEPPTVLGSAHAVALTTTLPVTIGTPPSARAVARLRVDDGALVLEMTPFYHAAEYAPAPAAARLTLADGVGSLTIGYWRRSTNTWLASWNENPPPDLLRITIGFTDPRRHWPAIVAAPTLSRYSP